MVANLPCTNSDNDTKRLKESDMVVTQPANIFDGDFDFIKRYFSELEKQQSLHVWNKHAQTQTFKQKEKDSKTKW